jgi:hypothetical protein
MSGTGTMTARSRGALWARLRTRHRLAGRSRDLGPTRDRQGADLPTPRHDFQRSGCPTASSVGIFEGGHDFSRAAGRAR